MMLLCEICISGSFHRPYNVNILTVFACSKAGVVGSNPTRGMDVCVRLFCVCVVLCVGSGLAKD
jgi:hypothetical protein